MDTIKLKTLYESPEVKVVEVKVRRALASSNPGGTDPYEREEW